VSSSRYEVEWTRSALRGLDRIPEKAATACIELVYGALAEDPRRVGRELRFDLVGKHSARRGDFRVVYEIDEAARVIVIIAMDHRSGVYRPRR
jgi:mRNA-degrading endonuclease RelE of RelBE toxin-antitoxin system